jgi:hypothetical protein
MSCSNEARAGLLRAIREDRRADDLRLIYHDFLLDEAKTELARHLHLGITSGLAVYREYLADGFDAGTFPALTEQILLARAHRLEWAAWKRLTQPRFLCFSRGQAIHEIAWGNVYNPLPSYALPSFFDEHAGRSLRLHLQPGAARPSNQSLKSYRARLDEHFRLTPSFGHVSWVRIGPLLGRQNTEILHEYFVQALSRGLERIQFASEVDEYVDLPLG